MIKNKKKERYSRSLRAINKYVLTATIPPHTDEKFDKETTEKLRRILRRIPVASTRRINRIIYHSEQFVFHYNDTVKKTSSEHILTKVKAISHKLRDALVQVHTACEQIANNTQLQTAFNNCYIPAIVYMHTEKGLSTRQIVRSVAKFYQSAPFVKYIADFDMECVRIMNIPTFILYSLKNAERISYDQYYLCHMLADVWSYILRESPTFSNDGDPTTRFVDASPFHEFVTALPLPAPIASDVIRATVEFAKGQAAGARKGKNST